jgi:Mg2+ and Co2+ transporter CorA
MKIKEDLIDILNDHKFDMVETFKEQAEEIEEKIDRMINEVNELLGSSYE